MMMQAKDKYITNGLVMYLDGINKGATPNAWSNLVGSEVFGNVAATSISNGWSFDGSGGLTKNGPFVSVPSSDYTMEIVFDANNNKNMILFATAGNGLLVFGFYGTGKIITGYHDAKKGYALPVASMKRTISLNINTAIQNGVRLQQENQTYYSGSNNISTIGYREQGGVNNPFTGEIYCIRVYNRLLTEAEMLHNQAIDNVRFNLGITM